MGQPDRVADREAVSFAQRESGIALLNVTGESGDGLALVSADTDGIFRIAFQRLPGKYQSGVVRTGARQGDIGAFDDERFVEQVAPGREMDRGVFRRGGDERIERGGVDAVVHRDGVVDERIVITQQIGRRKRFGQQPGAFGQRGSHAIYRRGQGHHRVVAQCLELDSYRLAGNELAVILDPVTGIRRLVAVGAPERIQLGIEAEIELVAVERLATLIGQIDFERKTPVPFAGQAVIDQEGGIHLGIS